MDENNNYQNVIKQKLPIKDIEITSINCKENNSIKIKYIENKSKVSKIISLQNFLIFLKNKINVNNRLKNHKKNGKDKEEVKVLSEITNIFKNEFSKIINKTNKSEEFLETKNLYNKYNFIFQKNENEEINQIENVQKEYLLKLGRIEKFYTNEIKKLYLKKENEVKILKEKYNLNNTIIKNKFKETKKYYLNLMHNLEKKYINDFKNENKLNQIQSKIALNENILNFYKIYPNSQKMIKSLCLYYYNNDDSIKNQIASFPNLNLKSLFYFYLQI